jgi:very-short-patch-repair endonuclease
MTEAEHLLWLHLRDRQLVGAKFRRQQPIGRYFTDFCCIEHQLIIEVDGGQHDEEEEYDRKRTAYLQKCGYRVVRFWNNEVLGELAGVLETIAEEIIGSPHPDPLPEGEGTLQAARASK